MKIIIGFSRAKSKFALFSRLIQWYDGVNYSHVYLELKSDCIDDSIVYEASGLDVHVKSKSRWKQKSETVYEFEFTVDEDKCRELLNFLVKSVGVTYGLIPALGIPIRKLLKLKSNPFSDGDQSYFCSELIAHSLQTVLDINDFNDLETLTPKDLYAVLAEYKQ